MAILSKQSAEELRRIIQESTGRNISLGESYAIWHYLIKLLQLFWNVEHRREPAQNTDQPPLFPEPRKVKKKRH